LTTTALTLAVVQFSPAFGQKKRNLELIGRLTSGLQADVIVLPELCTTGYYFRSRREVAEMAEPADGRTARYFQEMAQRHRAAVVAGFAESEGDRLFNACLIALPEWPSVRVYRKIHLFYRERDCFDPGDRGFFVVADDARDVRIGPMICYDWRFPEAARILTLGGAELIVCPSNLVTDAWRRVMPARAIENKVYLAVANRAGRETRGAEELIFKGRSAIYDVDGRPLQSAGPEEDEVLTAVIEPRKTRDKSFNPINDVLRDRRPQHYGPLVAKH